MIPTRRITALAVVALFCSSGMLAAAHVPYLEREDYTADEPFEVRRSIEQSIAVYAWLDNDPSPCEDVDVYRFSIDEPSRVYIEGIVPVCEQYEEFAPWFALVGPGLPEPEHEVPFDMPEGYGAVVTPNEVPEEGEREKFYEPFGGKWYYNSSIYDEVVNQSGEYYVVYWDPAGIGGDYVAIIGRKEIWRLRDILRGLLNTPLIRMDMELHVDCNQPPPPALFHPRLRPLVTTADW